MAMLEPSDVAWVRSSTYNTTIAPALDGPERCHGIGWAPSRESSRSSQSWARGGLPVEQGRAFVAESLFCNRSEAASPSARPPAFGALPCLPSGGGGGGGRRNVHDVNTTRMIICLSVCMYITF